MLAVDKRDICIKTIIIWLNANIHSTRNTHTHTRKLKTNVISSNLSDKFTIRCEICIVRVYTETFYSASYNFLCCSIYSNNFSLMNHIFFTFTYRVSNFVPGCKFNDWRSAVDYIIQLVNPHIQEVSSKSRWSTSIRFNTRFSLKT